jgi:Uma2 family endonuclease
MRVAQRQGVRSVRWTAKRFWRLVGQNFFVGRRVELIEGVLFEMAAQNNPHAQSVELTRDALTRAFGPNYWVRAQMSLDLTPHSVPDPDLAVVQGTVRGTASTPTTALLIVEVSETTLWHDRHLKGGVYARVGIPDYWIVNLRRRRLEVWRNPVPDPAARFGHRYADRTFLSPTDAISPLALPQARVAVADLLP